MTDAAGAEALQEASDGFFLAAEYGRSDVIKALADHGRGQIDLAAVVDPATGRSPLHVAVANGKTDALRVLLAAGFPPDVAAHAEGNQAKTAVEGDAPQTRKQTAYALAQQLAATDLVMVFHQFLIQQVASNNVAGVEQMLAAGVDVTVTDGASSSSLLHWAVSCQASDVLAYLLTRQDVQDQRLVNRRNCDGATPLHLAAHGNQPDCVRLLLDAEADTQLLGEKGFSNGKPAVELTTAPAVLELFNQKTMVHGGSEETISEIEVPTQANEGSNILGDACGQDGAVCEHAGQVGKLEHQLEEKDLLINQLKKSIEDLVLESQEIQKLGEERVMLDYVRKLREDKTLVQRQLEDANEYIAIQQEQIQDLKTQIKLLCDGKQRASVPALSNGHDEVRDIPIKRIDINSHQGESAQDTATDSADDEGAESFDEPEALPLKLDAWTSRSQRRPSADPNGSEMRRGVWNGLWSAQEGGTTHEEDGEVIMTV